MTVQPLDPTAVYRAETIAANGVRAIAVWAQEVRTVAEVMELLIDTPFIPAAFWPKFDPRDKEAGANARRVAVASATAAVIYGHELGIGQMNALTMVHVVKGKPGLYAEAMVALVRSKGHEIGVEDLTDHRCRVWGKRAGSETVHRAEFTMERAKKAGYAGQNAKYGSDPQAMLYARAVSILCRQMAPEVLKGLGSVEELADESDGTARPAARSVRRADVVQMPALAKPEPARTPEPAADLPPLPGEEETPDDTRMANAGQLKVMGAAFTTLGVKDRAERLAITERIVAHDVASAKDLTYLEAQVLLDTLSAAGPKIVAEHRGETPAEPEQPELTGDRDE